MKAVYGIILAAFFVLLGLISLIFPWSASIRTQVVGFLLSNSLILTLIGLSFLMIGLGVILQMLNGLKRRYVVLKEKGPKTEISEEVFEDYIKLYFNELFPKTNVPLRVQLKKKKAKVIADLPYIHEEEQEPLLNRIEDDLTDIFRELIGWRHDLLLAISFAPRPKITHEAAS